MHGISLKAAIPLRDAPSLHLGISIFNSLPKKVGYVTNISLVRFFLCGAFFYSYYFMAQFVAKKHMRHL